MNNTIRKSTYKTFTFVLIAWALLTAANLDVRGQGCPEASFTAASGVAVGDYPASVSATDLNLDGHADLATVDYGAGSISVSLGNGDGTFQPASALGGLSLPFSIAAADLDGDGLPDLAAANSGTSDVSILRGNGDGGFIPFARLAVGALPYWVSAADLNGDGNNDLLTANFSSNTVTVLLATGGGAFAAPVHLGVGVGPIALTVGDLDSNGTLDLAVVNNLSDSISILTGDGKGNFALTSTHGVGAMPGTVVMANFDSDGMPDLATANSVSNTLSVLLNDGNGSFNTATTLSAGNQPYAVSAADLNQDGRPDLVAANYGQGNIFVYLGSGNGTFSSPAAFPVGAGAASVAIGDFDEDGVADLATGNTLDDTVSVLINDCVAGGNTAPSVSTRSTSLPKGQVARSIIALVSDGQDDPNSLAVTINGGDTATINGVTVSGIQITTSGNIEADVQASCSATDAAFLLRVTDSGGLFGESTLNVTIAPSAPPVLTLNAPISLMPANHKMRNIAVSDMLRSAADDCDADVMDLVVIEVVSSDEPDGAEREKDDKPGDIVVGPDCRSVQLRAERNGNGDGRVYSIVLHVTDSSGNTASAIYKVSVPRNQSGTPAIEGSPAVTIKPGC